MMSAGDDCLQVAANAASPWKKLQLVVWSLPDG